MKQTHGWSARTQRQIVMVLSGFDLVFISHIVSILPFGHSVRIFPSCFLCAHFAGAFLRRFFLFFVRLFVCSLLGSFVCIGFCALPGIYLLPRDFALWLGWSATKWSKTSPHQFIVVVPKQSSISVNMIVSCKSMLDLLCTISWTHITHTQLLYWYKCSRARDACDWTHHYAVCSCYYYFKYGYVVQVFVRVVIFINDDHWRYANQVRLSFWFRASTLRPTCSPSPHKERTLRRDDDDNDDDDDDNNGYSTASNNNIE